MLREEDFSGRMLLGVKWYAVRGLASDCAYIFIG